VAAARESMREAQAANGADAATPAEPVAR
jgi:hypothetical protein